MNIAILLPLKEKYTKVGAGAVSILVNTHLPKSKYKKTTNVYGSKVNKPLDTKNFKPLDSRKNFFRNSSYVDSFEKKFYQTLILLNYITDQSIFFILKKNFQIKSFYFSFIIIHWTLKDLKTF